MTATGTPALGAAPATGELRPFALFAGVEAPVLERARRRMRLRVAAQGAEIVAQGSTDASDVFFILSGRVDVRMRAADGSAVWLARLGPGEIFGELQALDGVPRSGDVVAVETCRLAVMGAAAFAETVAGDPDLALRMMRILVARLRRLDHLFVERSAVDLAGRVGREILRRATPADGRIVVAPCPGPSEIARAIGGRRETVSRALAALERAGVIRREPGRLVVLDPRRLASTGAA